MTRRLGVLFLALSLTACASSRSAAPEQAGARTRHATREWRWVDTHGIEVAVPAAWPDDRGICGTPKADTVLWLEDGITTCLTSQPPRLSVVEFGGIVRRSPGWYRRHTTPVTISGARARRRFLGTVSGSQAVQLVFPARGISVTVLSPKRSLLHRILASIRVVRVNEDGCPTRPHPTYRLGERPSPRQPFLPLGVVRVAGCSYHGRWLDRSNRIGGRAARRLVRFLDAAPYGFSRAPRGSLLPSICGSSWRGSFIVARFEYPARRSVSVTAHLEGCDRLGASNGRWAVRIARRWVFRLVEAARYAGAFVDPRTVR